jgi:hypothetical protein
MVTPPTSSIFSPVSQSSTVSSLTLQSSTQSTNEALQEVLYGNSPSYIEVSSPPSLTTWNFGLRRLFVPDVLKLNKEDKLVIFLSTPPLQGCYLPRHLSEQLRLQLANDTLQRRHKFKRLGSSCFEFPVVLVLYSKQYLLYNDAIDTATLRLWVSQGEGFTVEFLDYPGQTILVKWRDLQDVQNIEILRLTTRNDSLQPISFG